MLSAKFGNVTGASGVLKDTDSFIPGADSRVHMSHGTDFAIEYQAGYLGPSDYPPTGHQQPSLVPLMQFDINSLIGQNYSIISADLHLFLGTFNFYAPAGPSIDVQIHRVNCAWGVDSTSAGPSANPASQGQATQEARFDFDSTSSIWWPAGGGIASALDSTVWGSLTLTSSGLVGDEHVISITPLVQTWASNLYPNYGLSFTLPYGPDVHVQYPVASIIAYFSNEAVSGGGGSSDYSSFLPYLEINYALRTPDSNSFIII